MSDVATVEKMLDLCRRYGLSGYDFAKSFPKEQLAQDFNGIGPEWFPEALRKAMDDLSASLLPAAFIHDIRWSHSDGTKKAFNDSNDELEENGITIAKELYCFINPKRYLLKLEAKAFAKLCKQYGRSAFEEAYQKSKRCADATCSDNACADGACGE